MQVPSPYPRTRAVRRILLASMDWKEHHTLRESPASVLGLQFALAATHLRISQDRTLYGRKSKPLLSRPALRRVERRESDNNLASGDRRANMFTRKVARVKESFPMAFHNRANHLFPIPFWTDGLLCPGIRERFLYNTKSEALATLLL